MATIEFKNAVGRVYFDGGLTDEGKLIRKSKTYRNIAENAAADNLYNALGATCGAIGTPVSRGRESGNIQRDELIEMKKGGLKNGKDTTIELQYGKR